MNFARNAAGQDALYGQLGPVPTETDSTLWALVDMALLEHQKVAQIARTQGWPLTNALQGSPLQAYADHAPVWIALPAPSPAVAQGMARLLALNPCAPALSLVRTHGGLEALLVLSAYLARARIDGDLLTHCRFADTRVLPVLLAHLTPSQQSRVAQAVQTWSWIDHLGHAAAWRPSTHTDAVEVVDTSECLELDAGQFAAMLDASEPDTMFALLYEHTPEVVPAAHRGDFRDRLVKILARADQRQLEAANDRLQFLVLALSCRDRFDEDAELQGTWHAIAQRKTSLVESMKAWSDALWDRLSSATPTRAP